MRLTITDVRQAADLESRMRYRVACAVLVIAATEMSFGAESNASPTVTVFLQFQGETSSRSVDALQTEVTRLLKPARLELEYRLGSELGPDDTPTDIIVVKFTGKCRPAMVTPILDERGPLAFTHISNGEILPFAEVACDRVRTSLASMGGTVHAHHGDRVLGRALGRVVAHEIYHILTKTTHHGKSGVARQGMSSNDLAAETLIFEEDDIRKVHEQTVAPLTYR
jgi:hypothetical protein